MAFRPIKTTLVAVALLSFAIPASAHDLWGSTAPGGFPAPWLRGSPGTTMQHWLFNTPTLPSQAEIFNNPNGTPFLLDTAQPGGNQGQNGSGMQWIPNHQGFNGVWEMNPMGPVGGGSIMVFRIPNDMEPQPFFKDIFLQVTWASDPGTPPEPLTLSVATSGPFGAPVTSFTPVTNGAFIGPPGTTWFHQTFRARLPFCPDLEYIQIRNQNPRHLFVDQVVIDTRCVPEPASLATLGIGAVAMFRRFRRRKA